MAKEISRKLMVILSIGFLSFGLIAGWFGRNAWTSLDVKPAASGRPFDRDVLAAFAHLKTPANVTVDENLGLVTVKGSKADVQKTNMMLNAIQETVNKFSDEKTN